MIGRMLLMIGLAIPWLVLGSMGHAQTPKPTPRFVTIATAAPGGLFYSIGMSIAKVVTDHSKIRAEVKPFGGSSAYIPLVNSKEVDMGVLNATDMAMAYLGPERMKILGKNPFFTSPNIRLIWRGAPMTGSMWVKKANPIRSVKELRGRRVAGEFPAQLASMFSTYGALISCGLTWNDVKVVGVSDFVAAIEALVDGRAESVWSAHGTGKLNEANAAVGIRMLSICAGAEAVRPVEKEIPGFYPYLMKAGQYPGVTEDAWGIAYDVYLVGSKDIPDAAVQEVVRSIWDFNHELAPIHPLLKEWTTRRAVDAGVTIPYHPGAVSFFKQKGAWTGKVDEQQARLLKLALPSGK